MKPLFVIHNNCNWCFVTKSLISDCQLCPKCGIEIGENSLRSIYLPSPFISTASKCCILLKPSINPFDKYKLGDDLHIGLSNLNGFVFSYTSDGTIVESFWDECLCIYQFTDNKECDRRMKMFVKKFYNQFTRQHYDETNWNCYDFVLEFLLDFGLLKRTRNVKEIFVTEHVCKALQRVLRYYSLLNKLSHRDANYPTLS